MATGHDADRPALTLFAAELRVARQHAGLTRDELSAKVNYGSSLIGMIETGRRVPSRDLAERLDEVFGPDRGTFARLQTGLRDLPYPANLRHAAGNPVQCGRAHRPAGRVRHRGLARFARYRVPGLGSGRAYDRGRGDSVAGDAALRRAAGRGAATRDIPGHDQESCRGTMDVTGATWRTSSYTGSGGGNCVEVGD
jgi:transcriptional regulator with XRE-family HTH domain